jgi:hypothetical protein
MDMNCRQQDCRIGRSAKGKPDEDAVSSTSLERIRIFGPDLQNEAVRVLVPPANAART